MKKKILCGLLILSVLLPIACTKPTVEDVNEPASATLETKVQVVEETDIELNEDLVNDSSDSDKQDEQVTDVLEETNEGFSDSTTGRILNLLNDCNGKDLDTAVEMCEEFFGTELINTSTLTYTSTDMETGIEVSTYYTVYYTRLYIDDFRFNNINFASNIDDGKVCRVELCVRNDEGRYAYSELSPLPDVPEVNGIYTSFTDEISSTCGEPFKSGTLYFDDDSYWAEYKYGDDCVIRLEYYDYTEEGGNGLIAFQVHFSNNSYL